MHITNLSNDFCRIKNVLDMTTRLCDTCTSAGWYFIVAETIARETTSPRARRIFALETVHFRALTYTWKRRLQ